MASLLARRKHLYSNDIENFRVETNIGKRAGDSKSKHQKTIHRGFENVIALVIVVLFVVTGLILGYFLLHHQHRKVIVHTFRNPWAHGRAALRYAATRKRHSAAGFHHHFYSGFPRFVTVVLPSVVNPQGRARRLDAIHDTWGPYSRAIYVLHNITEFPRASHLTHSENSKPSDLYSYPQNLLLPHSIALEDGIQRLIYTIREVHNRVNPDFAFFVNDHTFVISHHVCHFLESRLPTKDLYAGHALTNGKMVFNSGAAGYVLSRETMRKLAQEWSVENSTTDVCSPESTNPWLQGNPGLLIVQCLNALGISAIDTRNSDKSHLFHAFPLTRVVSGSVDDWYIKKHQMERLPDTGGKEFDESYSTLLSGEDCCSKDSVSFHYVESLENKALFAIRQSLLKHPDMPDKDLKAQLIQVWPVSRKELGAYSRGLPRMEDTDAWDKLMKTVRKVSRLSSEVEDC